MAIIDVGAGASTLVDGLFRRRLRRPDGASTFRRRPLRVARNPRKRARRRGALLATSPALDLPEATYDVWHDRAVFHTGRVRRAYAVRQVMKAVRHLRLARDRRHLRRRRSDRNAKCFSRRATLTNCIAEFGSAFQLYRAPRRTPRHSCRLGPALSPRFLETLQKRLWLATLCSPGHANDRHPAFLPRTPAR